MTTSINKLQNLLDDGVMDADTLLNIIITGMSESEAYDICEMPDFEGIWDDEDEDEDEKVDGIQARIIFHNDTPAEFHASIHMIDGEGDDVHPAAYTVDASHVEALEADDVELDDGEEIIDWFRRRDGLSYCDWYLEEHDDVVMV